MDVLTMDAIQILTNLRAKIQQERRKYGYEDGACWSVPEYPEGVQEGLDFTIDAINDTLKGLEDIQTYPKLP